MRSPAHNIARKFACCVAVTLVLCCSLAAGRPDCKCVCRPSPPGGTTVCQDNQIAVCGSDARGQCEGKCVTVSTKAEPLQYTARVVTVVIKPQKDISEFDLREQRLTFIPIVEKILESARKGVTVTISREERQLKVCVGLPGEGQDKLDQGLRQLKG